MINVAIPKGRLSDKACALFESIGIKCPQMKEDNRKLIFVSECGRVSFLMVKPSDAAIYVEHGAADIGIVGKDNLLETKPDVYELLDMKTGVCRIAVAAKNGFVPDPALILRVATKFPAIAAEFYRLKNRSVKIIKLNGSIELAPISGLSDVIVDLVETGTTLKENGLSVTEVIAHSSARLICNKKSYQFNHAFIERLVSDLKNVIEEKQND